jgi:hypothetical protein
MAFLSRRYLAIPIYLTELSNTPGRSAINDLTINPMSEDLVDLGRSRRSPKIRSIKSHAKTPQSQSAKSSPKV